MNKERRKELGKAIELLETAQSAVEEAQGIIECCKEEEEEYRDNMPENLQGSERYDMADNACEELDQACDYLSDLADTLGDAISSVENATE